MKSHHSTFPARLLLALIAGLALTAQAADAPVRIKKCQDAQGRWHYGDTAADTCNQSKVIELSGEGNTTREIPAPPTDAELKARAQNRQAAEDEKKRAEDEARRDQILLSTYGHEDDINFMRDRKISDLEQQIKSSQDTVTSLKAALERQKKRAADEQRGGAVSDQTQKAISNSESQITKHEALIKAKRAEQETIRVQFQRDLERYRQLKSGQPKAAAPNP